MEGVEVKTGVWSFALPAEGFVRLNDVLEAIPVSKSYWYKGIQEGKYPKPTKKFGSRIAAWDVKDIRKVLES
jgi:prophage regulatory protein